MIDRSRFDEQTDASLNIIQAAANLALIHERRLLSETAAELASDLYAMTDRYDEALAAIVRINDRVEEAEALARHRLLTIHVQSREAAKLRATLAVRDLDLAKVRAQMPQKRRNRIRWYHRAGALIATAAATLIVACESCGRAWVSLLGDDRHARWTGKIAALVGVVAFLSAVFLGGGGR